MALQPDITSLLLDPELGAQSFTINRTMGSWKKGRFIEEVTVIKAIGNIQPATAEELEQLPEGDRRKGVIVIRTPTPIYETQDAMTTDEPSQTPAKEHATDEIVWRGNAYKVLSAMMWADFGWYEAFATRK